MENDINKIFVLLPKISEEGRQLIKKAYDFAEKAHSGEKRKNGEPYFNHLFETAKNLAGLGTDATAVAAGFLHDVIENTKTPADVIERDFGKEVRTIVEGVTKLGGLRYHGADRHNESLRKLFLATSKDFRVLLVKLCDRLHNMRTLSFISKEKQERIARETLEIYAPIAYRMGIRVLSRELEDLAFPFVNPDGFKEITALLREGYEKRVENLQKFIKSVVKELAKAGFVDFHTNFRVKGLYSLYKKYLKNKKDFEKIYDILAMRITVAKTEDCYRALGLIHAAWRPLPGKIKDYIAFPKQNGYQSLHTTVFNGDGDLIEIQIRTEAMHKEAEYGVASHIFYKAEGGNGGKERKNKKELANWIKNMSNESELEIKNNFLNDRIFIFTPKGDVVDLPAESGVIDFAYAIHSDIGNHLAGAKINGKLSSLDTVLKGDEIVEILTNKNAHPNRKWLDFVKTGLAKKHIRNFLNS